MPRSSFFLTLIQNKRKYLLGFGGILIIVFGSVLTLISPRFASHIALTRQPVVILVTLMVFSGVVYFYISITSHRFKPSIVMITWIICAGIVLRVLMLCSTPILEDDYFRYLWDGAVLASGNNPYAYSPEQVMKKHDQNLFIPTEIQGLAAESGEIVKNINHPHLRTIYPPIAQTAFATAHLIKPWSVLSWRLLLLVFDAMTILLVYRIIKKLNLPQAWLLIYWWNPLLIKEIYNSGHLDVIVFPFVLGALILYMQKKNLWSVFTLSLAIGIKIWPIALMPLMLRPLLPDYRRLLLGLGILLISSFVFFTPFYLGGIGESSGLLIYGKSWQNNDSFFRIILWISEPILEALMFHPGHGQFLARLILLAITSTWVGYVSFRKIDGPLRLFESCLLITAFIFLTIPTQFPWYYTWLIPFLTICPRTSLILLTVLLPLYYLRYYLEARGMLDYFSNIVVWIEFVPVWILLFMEWRLKRE